MDIALKFSAQPEIENGLPTRFRGVAYNGDTIKNYGTMGNVIVDLDNIKLSSETLVLTHHDHKQRIGVASLSLKGGKVVFEGRFSENETALQIRRECAEGMPWELSLGLVGEVQKVEGTQVVNGRFADVRYVIRKATVKELSFVSWGAADNTKLFTFSREKIDFAKKLFNQVASAFNSGDVRRDHLNLATLVATTAKNGSCAELERSLFNQVAGSGE